MYMRTIERWRERERGSDGLDPIIDSQFSIVSSANVPHSIDEHQNRYCVVRMDQILRLQSFYSKLCHNINSIQIYIAINNWE